MTALQDRYPEDYAHCYGCGRLNTHGLHVRTEWVDGEGVARFQPAPHHMALPGFVYGGLIASLIDCHAMATAGGASVAASGGSPTSDPTPRFVTASLEVTYLRPTPLGPELTLKARATQRTTRATMVEVHLYAGDVETAMGRVVAVPAPAAMLKGS